MKTIHTPDIFTIDNFLTPEECNDYIFFSETKGYEEATVSLTTGAKMMKGIRNNDRVIYEDEQLAQKLWNKLQPHVHLEFENIKAIGLNPRFRFYRYENEQRFNKHRDGRVKISDTIESRATFMVYLSDDFDGGETEFETLKISPKKGMALCFVHELKHKGCKTTNGVKYVLRTDILYQNLNHKNP